MLALDESEFTDKILRDADVELCLELPKLVQSVRLEHSLSLGTLGYIK